MRLLAFVFVTAMVAAACSDDPKRPPPAQDDGMQPGVPGSGSGSGSGGGPALDAGADGGDGGLCTDLANTGTLLDQLGVPGDPPAGSGGQIAEGTYDLVEARLFSGSSGAQGPTGISYQGSVRLTATTYEANLRATSASSGKTQTRISRGTYTTLGANLTLSLTCPTAIKEVLTFSVVGQGFVLTNPLTRESFTYFKQ